MSAVAIGPHPNFSAQDFAVIVAMLSIHIAEQTVIADHGPDWMATAAKRIIKRDEQIINKIQTFLKQ